MSDCVMETICTNCENRKICKYVNEVAGMYSLINDIKPTMDKPYNINIYCNERKIISRRNLPSSNEITNFFSMLEDSSIDNFLTMKNPNIL